MKLRQLQALFWDAIRHPTGIDNFLDQAPAARREQFATALVDTPDFSRRARMSVYAESYFWRLSEVLGQQYRVVAWFAGPQRFHNLTTDFVWAHPSTSRDVRRFGRGFADYIAAHPIAAEIVGLEDLARVERAVVDALDSPNIALASAQTLQALPLPQWPSMTMLPPPWVKLVPTRRSYPQLDQGRRDALPSPDPIPPLDGLPHATLVWRRDLEVFHRSVTPPEARALTAMLQGASFERICSAAGDPSHGDAAGPEQVVAWLQRWLDAQLVAQIR